MHSQLPICRVFMLCEDNAAFIRAMNLRDMLASDCCDQVVIFAAFSRFDWLHAPKLNQHTQEFLQNADLIVIVADGSRHLPPAALAWINRLSHHPRSQKTALALSLSHPSAAPALDIHSTVEQVAASLKVDFFSNLSTHPDPASTATNGYSSFLTRQNMIGQIQPRSPIHPPWL